MAQSAAYQDTLSAPTPIPELDALVVPPHDWTPEPFKNSLRHTHEVWVSPGGGAAYGVIHFTLPLPVGEEIALRGFLAEMKRAEGEATLLSKNRDGDRLRFVAEGGKYRIRGILLTNGFYGWAVYAGSLRSRPVAVDDLALAVQARENTALGLAGRDFDANRQTRMSKSP
ncbi:MAG: hypothetical protein QOF78_3464 [Phycisphaerales bacterium]|nr:hypothetical protein [Phycisphaerales bacterium]